MLRFIRTHPIPTAAVAVVVLAASSWLAFGWFGIHTAFFDREVDEPLPEFTAASDPPADGPTADANEITDADPAADADTTAGEATADVNASNDTGEMTVADTTSAPDESGASPESAGAATIGVDARGQFTSLSRYTTEGEAIVLGDGSGQRFLRFEEFSTNNGPDLNVYLVNSSTGDVSDYVDLGDLKGNVGEQNYEIPSNVDLDVYDTVMIWCVRFSVGFGQATLTAT